MANSNMQATDAVAQDTVSASGEFDALLNQAFRPKTTQAAKAVEAAVQTLAQQALANTITVSDDAYKSISAIIAQIDFKLTEQIKLILQHPDWQKLESSWRGMEHLVYNTETDEKLKIRFMNLSKDELRRNMKRYKGIAWDQSPMFKKLYEAEYGQLGGETLWLYHCGLLLRPYTARCGSAWLYRQSRRVGPCAVYCRGFPLGTANGLLAGAGESPRPDQNRHPEPGICAVELAAG